MSTIETERGGAQLPPTSTGETLGNRDEARAASGVAAGGSFIGALAGAAAVVLAIIGLAGEVSAYMAPIAVIVLGVGLIFEGATAVARRAQMLEDRLDTDVGDAEVGGGLSGEFLAGLAGIVLGILALIGMVSVTLVSVAVLVFGAALLLGSVATSQLCCAPASDVCDAVRAAMREAAIGAAGAKAMVGLAAIVLGILALVHATDFNPPLLNLVALLVLGVSFLLSGLAVGGRMVSMMRQ